MMHKNLQTFETQINSELSSKIKNSSLLNNELLVEINEEDLIEVLHFLKTNKDFKFRQLIDIAGVDYPEITPGGQTAVVASGVSRGLFIGTFKPVGRNQFLTETNGNEVACTFTSGTEQDGMPVGGVPEM